MDKEILENVINDLILKFQGRCPEDYTSIDYGNLIKVIGQVAQYASEIQVIANSGYEVPAFYGIATPSTDPLSDKGQRNFYGWYLASIPGVYDNFPGDPEVYPEDLEGNIVLLIAENDIYKVVKYPINVLTDGLVTTDQLDAKVLEIESRLLQDFSQPREPGKYVESISVENGQLTVERKDLPEIQIDPSANDFLWANDHTLGTNYIPLNLVDLDANNKYIEQLIDDSRVIHYESADDANAALLTRPAQLIVWRTLAHFEGQLYILGENIEGVLQWQPIANSQDGTGGVSYGLNDCVALDPNGNLTVRHDDSLYIENSELKVNFTEVDEQIANLKDEITDLNTELQEVQSDIKNCKSNIQQIRDEQAEMIEEAVNNKLNSGELELPSYAKKYELDSKIDKRELSQYVDTAVSSLVRANELNAYATKELLDNYVTTEDAASFVTNDKLEERLSTFLPTDLTDYPTKSEVARDYAAKSYLSNFATINDLTKMLSNIQIGAGGLSDITVSERDYGLIFGNTAFYDFNYFKSAILAFTDARVFEKGVDWDPDSNNGTIFYLKLSAILKLLILFLMFAADLSLVKTASVTSTDE